MVDGRWYVVMVGNQKRYKREKEWREGYNADEQTDNGNEPISYNDIV